MRGAVLVNLDFSDSETLRRYGHTMGAATFVGRLGPLAATLGVGLTIIVGGTGVATAEPVTRDASAASDRSVQPAATGTARGGRDSGARGAMVRSGSRPVAGVSARHSRPDPASEALIGAPDDFAALQPTLPADPPTVVVGRGARPQPAPSTAATVALDTAHPADIVRRANSPADIAPPAAESTGAQQPSAQADATDPVSGFFGGLAAFFNNQTPRINPTQVAQSPTGVVTGQLNAVDPDSPRLGYTISVDPTYGVAAANPDGSWTYTPDVAVAAGVTDSFRVTVSDAPSGFAIHGLAGLLNLLSFGLIGSRGDSSTSTVAVTVAPFTPANRAPVMGVPSVGTPNAVSGVVTGSVGATDADGDTLTYSAPPSTAKGAVSVNAGTGLFTYTPSALARHRAAALSATPADRADSFTVTATDGRGGTATAAVVVTISPANTNPVTVTPSVGTPNAVSGVVTGSVSATDADGDTLTYSAPASTAKGTIGITGSTGVFSYTPSVAARNAAAAPGATPADRADSFTVSVTDAHGGTATAAVTVAISPAVAPANRAPVMGVPSVGTPNAVSGVVTGSVSATDADGDTLIYSAPASTAKGTIGIDAGTGAFTYAPTVAARNTAATPGATPADRADGFTVTVIDGRGGTATAAVTVAISPTPDPSAPLAAFPGAEGFGAYATGGRDGSVIYVTNLNAAGPGSLQWAIDQPGARYVLFKVSGLIDTQIHLTNGDVTIAGQTSPGGITIRGLVTDETPYQDQTVRAPEDFAENWILQHIRIRPGATGPADDGLRLRYTRNAIVDHVSIGNAVDEAIEISYSNNITVQNTLLAETVGGHAFYGGILMNYSNPAYGFGLDNVSLHHNVFNRIEGRLPEGSRESAAAANSFMNLELSNNLYWDPRFFIALGVDTAVAGGQPIYWRLNAVNNFFRTANGFRYGMFDDQILNVVRNELFVSGNKMNLYPSRSDYQLFYCCNDYPAESSPNATSRNAQARITRHPFPAITYTPTDQLRTVLLNTAGAWPRDPMDTRLMSFVAADTLSVAPTDTNPAGDALLPAFTGPAPTAPTDTDSDGMPDAWEIVKGTNPNVANTNARTLSSVGYTDLEVYLNELSTSRITGTV
ncbi:MAG: Ig-like domain-containing protein [Mycobacterium sp.]